MAIRSAEPLSLEPPQPYGPRPTRRALLGWLAPLTVAPLAAACGAASSAPASAGATGTTGATGSTGAASSGNRGTANTAAGAAANAAPKEPPPAPAKLKAGSTIVFWCDLGNDFPALMQTWANRFEQQTGVKVEVSGGVQDYANKLTAGFASGAPPDVYRYLQETFPIVAAVERSMLLKLDSFIKRDKFDFADFRKDSVELYRWKGSLWAMPRAYGLQVVFYNTDLFTREGIGALPGDWNDKTWTFDRFVEASQRLTRSGERSALFVPRASRLWESFVYSNGGAVVKANGDGLATEFALTESPAVEALQLMQDLIYKHKVAPTPEEEKALGDPVLLMQNGQLAMHLTNPGGNVKYRSSGMAYDVAPFPIGKATRRGVGGGGTGWGAAAPTKFPEEAWALLTMLTGKEVQTEELHQGSTTPVRLSIANSDEYLQPDQPPRHSRVFSDGQEFVVRDPVHTKWPDVERDVVNKLLNEQLWSGKSTAAQVTKQIKELGDPYFK